MTVRSFLSDISNSLKSLNLDQFIPPKWLYLKSQSVIANFLAKDNNSNKQLFKQNSGWASLECVEMKEVDVTTCNISLNLCQKLMRSKHPLPNFYETKYGSLIRQVTSLDYSTSYDNVFSPRLWEATQKREFKSKKYFFIIDNFIYIPIPKGDSVSSPTQITLQGYFRNLKDVVEFNNIKECDSCSDPKPICKSILEYEMVIPTYLEDDVKKEVVLQVLNTYGRINKDEYSNLNSLDLTKKPNE